MGKNFFGGETMKKYQKYCMSDVTSHPLANQAEAYLFGRSLNTSLCEIYDHKAAFLLVKSRNSLTQKFQFPYMEETYQYYR